MPKTKEQRRKWRAAYYKRHRASVLAKANQYYAENKQAVLVKAKSRHQRKVEASGRVYVEGQGKNNPNKHTPRQREARKKERVAELRAWRKANPEKHKAQTKRHYANKKHVFIANMNRRRALKRGETGTYTEDDIKELMKKQKGKCVFCLREFGDEEPEVDHYVPLALGGSNKPSNLRLLHMTCNRTKQAKHPADFGLSHGLLAW